jgi:hypothetical protein
LYGGYKIADSGKHDNHQVPLPHFCHDLCCLGCQQVLAASIKGRNIPALGHLLESMKERNLIANVLYIFAVLWGATLWHSMQAKNPTHCHFQMLT